MSRSYKKNPVAKETGDKKSRKQIANRTVRRRIKDDEDMPARLQHKKMTESWDITDFKTRMTREEAIAWYNDDSVHKSAWFKKHCPTLKAWLKYWEKWYVRKQVKNSRLYYNDIYLGTLYENGEFSYTLNSSQSQYMDMEITVHVLETIRKAGLDKGFDFHRYLTDWKEFSFKNQFEFK